MRSYLQAARPRWVRVLLIPATLPLTNCDWLGITEAPISGGVVALAAAPPSAPADGASVVLVTAEVDTLVSPAITEVKFATTLGTFTGSGATVAVDADGRARAQLRAPAEVGTAIVTATVGSATRTAVVAFVPAPPTRLEVVAERFAVQAGVANSIAITATPLRTVGAPSPGTLVTFSADTVGGTGGSFGEFSTRSVLVRSGPATTRFSPGETSFRGRVVIRAVATMAGQSVTDSTVVTVAAP